MVALLVENNADINVRDNDYMTPCNLVAREGKINTKQILYSTFAT